MNGPMTNVGRLPAATAFRSPPSSNARSGFTLLELLLAVAIALVVVAILYAVYHVVLRSTETGERNRSVAGRAMEGIDVFSRDIQSAYMSEVETNCAFLLEDRSLPGRRDAVLEFCATVASGGETDQRWYDVLRLRYERIREGGEDRLVRIHRIVGHGDDGAAVTNVAARFVSEWSVEVYDGEAWVTSWSAGETQALPQAAHIRLTILHGGEERGFDTTVFIPAGNGAEWSTGSETNRPEAVEAMEQ